MKQNALVQFRRMREALVAERETLTKRLAEINGALGEAPLPTTGPTPGPKPKRGGTFRTPEWRAKIAAAQRRRWARQKGQTPTTQTVAATETPNRRTMSAASRRKIAAAARARWAKAKAAGKSRL